MPIYDDPKDEEALRIIQEAMPEYEVVGIECSALVPVSYTHLTALMAVGLERGKQLLEQQPQLKVCLIYGDHATGALKTYNNGLELHEIK